MADWISVKDRLPEPMQDVLALACTEDKRMQIGVAEWCGKRWFSTQIYCNQDDIKYWMLLPEPPKEEV